MSSDRRLYFLYALAAAAAVYVFAHQDALTNPYVVADDTRQQIYWMQKWLDPELFQDDLLTRYARNYVPWGVQAIYALAAPWMNPLQFTKVVSGILFVVTAGFLFGLSLKFRDDITPIIAVGVFCFFGDFINRIAGGISQSFAYPLLVSYLFFLSRENLPATGCVLLLASLLNPYIFLLCLVTQGIFLLYQSRKTILERFGLVSGPTEAGYPHILSTGASSDRAEPVRRFPWRADMRFMKSLPPGVYLFIFLVAVGCSLMAAKYVYFKPTDFGELVSESDMVGHIEYTAAGRYEIMPVPSLWSELISPWSRNLPFKEWGLLPGWGLVISGIMIVGYACRKKSWITDGSGFHVFIYLFAASLVLYTAARVLIFRLFLPARYLEFSLNVFYCLAIAVCLRETLRGLLSRRATFPVLTTLLFVLAALRLYHVGIYDYSDQKNLYQYLRTTPRTSLMAGHPCLMDNILTFACRKAFVTYELSHTWDKLYWQVIKKRTLDFFSAYYSPYPSEIRLFCTQNKIDYIIIRLSDFNEEETNKDDFYFEPFGSYIRELVASKPSFALLDLKTFPPVYEKDGIRVIRMRGG